LVPAATPQPIIDKIHQETVRALSRPEVRARFETLGMETIGNTPAEFAAVIAAETPQWAKVIRDAGVKAE
jgi:tripartite-type tricarboxylate transporter receptor subunit TctC